MKESVVKETNEMEIFFDANSGNEGFARVAVAAFMTDTNPTLEEVSDVKTAVSEAVTNAVIHGYGNANDMPDKRNKIKLICSIQGRTIKVTVEDYGVGIEDIHKAMEPLFTTKPELERSGMGFAFMEAFMDDVQVFSKVGEGTRVVMEKTLGKDA